MAKNRRDFGTTNDKETFLEGDVATAGEDVRPLLTEVEDILDCRHAALGALLALVQVDVRRVLRVDVELFCRELGERAAVRVWRHAHGLVAAVAQVHAQIGAPRHGWRRRRCGHARRAVQLRLGWVFSVALVSRSRCGAEKK